jgi:hypothetical protein
LLGRATRREHSIVEEELPMPNGDMLLIMLSVLAFLVVLGALAGAHQQDATRRRTRTHD